MQIITGETNFNIENRCAVIIGKFDGVHLGHRLLIDEALLLKKSEGVSVVVFTFEPSPSVYLGFEEDISISPKFEKRKLLESLEIDYLIEFPMNDNTASINAEDFIKEYLVQKMNAAYILCGDDLSFGYKGRGNYELLKSYEDIYSFQVRQMNKVMLDGDSISSSRIKKCIVQGQVDIASKMLGRCYSFEGEIVHGAHLGTSIGFPTINLVPESEKLLPKYGVYYSRTTIDGISYKSITNIGNKPTVNNEHTAGVETYIYDFDKDVYGKYACVELLGFKRPEMRFGSVSELKEALLKDIDDGTLG